MRMELTDDNLEEYLNENFKNRFNNLMSLSNTDLRKEIENSNWSFILQELRWAGNEINKYKNVIDKIKEYIPKLRRTSSYELDEKLDDILELLEEIK